MRAGRWGLATTVVATIGVVAGTLASPAVSSASSSPPLPPKQAFYHYTGSTPLSKIAPGTVLKKRKVNVSVGSSSTPVPAEQLLYRTRTENGKPAVTVTTVIEPSGTPNAGDLVGYLSFYDALGPECDPSYTLMGGNAGTKANQQQAEEEQSIIGLYLGQGYPVTIPDFEGEHLDWASGQEAGWTTLDAVRATESYLSMPTTTDVGLTGYSGGSIAAEWASELAPNYAPKLNLVGVAAGGIPVDFAHNLNYINGTSDGWSGVIPAVLVSLSRAFHVKNLNHFLSAKGRKITHAVHDECIGSFAGNYPGLRIQSLLKTPYRNFLAQPVFARIVNHLIMGTATGHPAGPLFLAVGQEKNKRGDGIMVTKDVEALAHEYCQQGVPLQFTVYSNEDHSDAGVSFVEDANSFLSNAFLGVPFSSNCSSVGKGNSLKPLPIHHKHKK